MRRGLRLLFALVRYLTANNSVAAIALALNDPCFLVIWKYGRESTGSEGLPA
jgi:hypothetical protein